MSLKNKNFRIFATEKTSRSRPVIGTASLPDIVFMLLFFFMVTTVMREEELLVEVSPPSVTEIVKIEKRSLVDHIHIGRPINDDFPDLKPRIQLDDAIAEINEIGAWKADKILNSVEGDKPKLLTSLHVDKETEMGTVTEVKTELRKVGALKINYAATQSDDPF